MVHNHGPSGNLKSHPAARIFTSDEKSLIANMTNAGASPRAIYTTILDRNPNILISTRDIWYQRSLLPSSSGSRRSSNGGGGPSEITKSPSLSPEVPIDQPTDQAIVSQTEPQADILLPEATLDINRVEPLTVDPLTPSYRLLELTKYIYSTIDATNRQAFRESIMKFFSDEQAIP
ncbi:hypothetical protein J3Q64DRAFT_1719548 [Phycomyces blakesleeanus]|uniref:Homeodomain-like DNA binding domain-containing transcription factor n=1 Tax=Phycomyces blakesleeanus TaxID=4837 RepID=A0ABR3BB06_PHYBL